jgi:hypothetical protein
MDSITFGVCLLFLFSNYCLFKHVPDKGLDIWHDGPPDQESSAVGRLRVDSITTDFINSTAID